MGTARSSPVNGGGGKYIDLATLQPIKAADNNRNRGRHKGADGCVRNEEGVISFSSSQMEKAAAEASQRGV